ncbi:UBA/THIF-type NAD/FAD binding protein [Catenovulum agarivorans DS-2]|uniref:UBA/THIF-type NAD/FAD binding protein n=1 Tax=Catenovulum agarivorans DS-2 TaxID=1328313 RepID=W7QGV5_9ALTE|nr:HesA/MoeB/ThiF family protein [Catenovulum agarivorans]EWH08172.1 UBA/THIF-type NAD/FAD binding protein [Catenovulum agarivorans DS-2]
MLDKLSDQEATRYSRHLLLGQIGEQGQIKLKNAHAVVVGAGGLGSPVCLYLAAAGVGKITIIDPDVIEVTNLQRQVLYKTNHIGRGKAQMAANQMQALNPLIEVNAVERKVESSNFLKLIEEATAVLDCTDNISSRYFINQSCVSAKVPLISAAAIRGEGQFMMFNFRQHKSPCYHCVFPDLDNEQSGLNCSNAGVVGPLLGLMGSKQALEFVKYVVQPESCSFAQLHMIDIWSEQNRQFKLTADPTCPVCSG